MKIAKILPQFKRENALLVVTGRQAAEVYYAHDKTIAKVDSFVVTSPKYTDKRRGCVKNETGEIVCPGYVDDFKRQKIEQKFLDTLKNRLKNTAHRFQIKSIYLFSPVYMVTIITKALSPFGDRIKSVVGGNYTKCHQFILLSILNKRLGTTRKEAPCKKDARKILEQFGEKT